jgi:N-formylglutamate amidohydrolase
MTLPILASVPHAGLAMPAEVERLADIDDADVVRDGDEQAADIYLPLRGHVAHLVTTDIARAFVDLNRPEDDLRGDGVVKTHTCWDVPVYRAFPPPDLIEKLLERYHRPYHRRLTDLAREGAVRVGIDCHTMAEAGPPVGPDPGSKRPWACVSDADGACDPVWTTTLAHCLAAAMGVEAGAAPGVAATVRVNDPFAGGYIVRSHMGELPWLQLEVSRGGFLTAAEKSQAVLIALEAWYETIFPRATP